jgi:hypothetical protein
MKEDILTQNKILFQSVDMPKGYEIDREYLKGAVYDSVLLKNKRKSPDRTHFDHLDFGFVYTSELDRLFAICSERFHVKTKLSIMRMDFWANNFYPNEQSPITRNRLVYPDLREAPDWVMIYALEKHPDSSNLVFEYEDTRGQTVMRYHNFKTNDVVWFPSNLKYRFEINRADTPSCFIGVTYTIR